MPHSPQHLRSKKIGLTVQSPVEKSLSGGQVTFLNLFADLGCVHFSRSPLQDGSLSRFQTGEDRRDRKNKERDK